MSDPKDPATPATEEEEELWIEVEELVKEDPDTDIEPSDEGRWPDS